MVLCVWLDPAGCAGGADLRAADVHAAAAQPTVQWTGRFDRSDPAGPRCAWSASAVSVRFAGASLSVRLRDEGSNLFEVVVDGVPSGVLGTGPARELYTVASGLAPGEHEVTLSKRTEAFFGEVQFLGFVPGPGGALRPASPWRPARRIEFIGDSITAGYGDEGAKPTCPFSAATENEFVSYGAIAARALGAEHTTIAWSGKTVAGMAALYDRALPARPDSPWDHSAWVPDVVVINLGTNDFFQGDVQKDAFTASYGALVDRVRSLYPRALVVCALGPMLSDLFPVGAQRLSKARRYLQAVVDRARSAGDDRVELVEFPTQDTTTAGCGFHPGRQSHRQMADRLAAEIRSALGW
jgi:lysophospholipase L1-like esterase